MYQYQCCGAGSFLTSLPAPTSTPAPIKRGFQTFEISFDNIPPSFRAVDPHSLYADPDPAVFLNAYPDPDPGPGPGLA